MANAIDDTASYARVYQTVMTADRRRSRSVETWTGFPIPRTLLQPIISDGQLELFRVGNPPLTASLAAVSRPLMMDSKSRKMMRTNHSLGLTNISGHHRRARNRGQTCEDNQ